MKTCSTCKKEKPYTKYYKCNRYKDNHFGQCKFCINEKRKERKDKVNKKQREYYQQNKQYYITKGYLRNKKRQQAQPKWLTEEHLFILQEIYDLRRLRSEATGVEHHVDHIVPLRGQDVCGLHVPWNLQVIPATENLSKGNTYKETS